MQPKQFPDDLVHRALTTERQRNAALLRTATELFMLDATHDLDELRRYEELALHFLPRVPPDDRRFVAEQLAEHSDAPHAVICALARDRIEIANPVLLRSAVLTPVDLLAVIAATGAEHQCLIAQRPALSPDVQRALRLAGMPDVLADLGDASVTETDAEPMQAAGFYYASTTRDPWRFLALDRRARLRLIAEIASRPAADERGTAGARADRAFRSILGAARIVGFARGGRLDAIIETISDALDLPADLVGAAASDPGGELLAIMLKALRLDDMQARQVLLLSSPAGREIRSFFPLSDLYAGMEIEVAEAMVASWRAAAPAGTGPAHQPHFADNTEHRRPALPVTGRTAMPDQRARRA